APGLARRSHDPGGFEREERARRCPPRGHRDPADRGGVLAGTERPAPAQAALAGIPGEVRGLSRHDHRPAPGQEGPMASSPPVDLAELLARDDTKWNARGFGRRYEHYFAPRRDEPLTILEIGIGGYDDPAFG